MQNMQQWHDWARPGGRCGLVSDQARKPQLKGKNFGGPVREVLTHKVQLREERKSVIITTGLNTLVSFYSSQVIYASSGHSDMRQRKLRTISQ